MKSRAGGKDETNEPPELGAPVGFDNPAKHFLPKDKP
jgi:hypothetical protein